MSRRSQGPKIAEMTPSFTFPCKECNNRVIFPIKKANHHLSGNDDVSCGQCQCIYTGHDLNLILDQKLAIPSYVYTCPYCHEYNSGTTHFVAFNTDIDAEVRAHTGPDCPCCGGPTEESSIIYRKPVRLEHKGYHMELPKLVICTGCNRPVRGTRMDMLVDTAKIIPNEYPDLVRSSHIPSNPQYN